VPAPNDAMTPGGSEVPAEATASTVRHRVAFYETDAMGIVHHSNYVRFFEHARVCWLAEHDQPYTAYVEGGLNFATTHVSVDYLSSARFDDELSVTVWLEWVRGASLRMAYRIDCNGTLAVTGATEHAAVNADGQVRRIPKENRTRLLRASAMATGRG
jgi:acyl-CoA thioester hydrolase